MSSLFLKVIAFTAMVLDHTAIAFGFSYYFRCFGRIAFPLFAFMISEGCKYTRNFKSYLFRLLFCAIASEPIYDIMFNESINLFFDLNVIFTLFFAALSIYIFEYSKKNLNSLFGLWFVLFFTEVAQVFRMDYGFLGVMLIFLLYVSKNKSIQLFVLIAFAIVKYYQVLLGALSVFLRTCFNICFFVDFQAYFFAKNFWYFIFTLISVLFIFFYNGKKGISVKYLFYTLYPLHIFLLFVIKSII